MNRKGQPKRPTQRDVGRLAGVSQGVVSVVLNNGANIGLVLPETREKVLAAARELDYRVNPIAKQLRLGKSTMVNIFMPKRFNRFLRTLVPLIEERLVAQGLRAFTTKLNGDDPYAEKNVLDVMTMDFAGTIVLYPFGDKDAGDGTRGLLDLLRRYRHPVFLECAHEPARSHNVTINFDAGVEDAVAHLAARGRRRIALALNDTAHRSMNKRREGYLRGLRRHGLPARPELSWVAAASGLEGLEGSRLKSIAEVAVECLVIRHRADAVIASNDEWAIALVKVLRRRGMRVPEDLAVIGYGDDPDLCWACDPELSSVNHGDERLADALVDTLLASLRGKRESADFAHVAVDSYFVPRLSG